MDFDRFKGILAASDLTPADKLIAVYLLEKLGVNNYAWPSQDTIRKDCGLKSKQTVINSLNRLKNRKVIRVEIQKLPAKGKTNKYFLTKTGLINGPVKEEEHPKEHLQTSQKNGPVKEEEHSKEHPHTGLKNGPVGTRDQSKKCTSTGLKNVLQPVQKLGANKPMNKPMNNSKRKYGDFVLLTDAEFWKLITTFGMDKTRDLIEVLNNGIGSKGYKYKSHYHTILNWHRRNESSQKNAKKTRNIDFSLQQSRVGRVITA